MTTKTLSHISERPWSEYTAADYTVEQWHRACLIHQHQGAPTSKNQCKLPVRTPDGAINRNGVHAAAAALAGARGGVQASPGEKADAAAALRRLYGELDEDLPNYLKQGEDLTNDILAHYGIKGMHWGVRRTRQQIDADAEDVVKVKTHKAKVKTNRTTDVLSNKELQELVNRMNLEQQYSRLTAPDKNSWQYKMRKNGQELARDFIIDAGQQKIVDVVSQQNPAAGKVLGKLIEQSNKGGKKNK